jgi:hypothetical protein
MQVGLIAYTTSDALQPGPDGTLYDNRVASDAPVDMVMEVDWVRFAAPRAASTGAWASEVGGANPLTDPNLSEAEVLRLIGP